MPSVRSGPLPEGHQPVPLGDQDELWLNMDRPNNLMVIDSLVWLHDEPDWDVVRQTVISRIVDAYPVFRCRPESINGRAHWGRDPQFRLSRHVRKARLRGDVDEERVRDYVSQARSKPFDPDHPLWSIEVVYGVRRPDDSIGAASLLRIHHSIADGIRLTELALGLCDPVDQTVSNTIGAKVGRGHRKGRTPLSSTLRVGRTSLSRLGSTVAREVRDPLGTPVRAASGAFGLLSTAATEAAGIVARPGRTIDLVEQVAGIAPGGTQTVNTVTGAVGVLTARGGPEVCWTGTPGIDKHVAWLAPIPLATIKQIGRATGTTVNDVVLGAVAGMLREYLLEHGDEPNDVTWMMPVSVLPYGQGMPKTLGNHFALVRLRLPAELPGGAQRLHEVHRRIERIKNSQETALTFGIQRVIAQSPQTMSVALTNYFANFACGVLTNVPGPREPVTFAGVLVDAMLGWAPSSGDQPLTICIYSYAGQVYVALAADRTLVPDVGRMVELLQDQVDQLQSEHTA